MADTLQAHEVIELVEATIAALTPSNSGGEYDGFVISYSPDEAISRDRDRSVMVQDIAPPTRKAGSGGCDLASLRLLVTILYGVTRDSRARRLADSWQIEEALRGLRSTANPAIRLCKPEGRPSQLLISGLGILAGWDLTIEYHTV